MCDHTPNGTMRSFVELWRTDEGWEALGFMVRDTGRPEAVVEVPDDPAMAMEAVAELVAGYALEADEILETEE